LPKYWEVLNSNGITKERLATYERKITTEPWYKPEAIGDFEGYLQILKEMHSSDDLVFIANEAKRSIQGETVGHIDEVLRNYNDHDTLRQMDRVSKLRYSLRNHFDKGNQRKLKDVMFLDLVLEGYLRSLAERIIHLDIGFEAFIREGAIILGNLSLSYEWDELNVCKEDWAELV
jgi:alpha-glucan,water dikinase